MQIARRPLLVAVVTILSDRQDKMARGKTKRTKAHSSRTVSTLEEAEEYLVQGAVINAESQLQDAFFGLFRLAVSLERHGFRASGGGASFFNEHALAIWHVVQSDVAQRQMAMQAISTLPTELNLEPALYRLEWVMKALADLNMARNDLAHNWINFVMVNTRPKPEWLPMIGGSSSRPASRARTRLVEDTNFWFDVAHDFGVLANLVRRVTDQIMKTEAMARQPDLRGRLRVAWPREPKLRSRSRLAAIKAQVRSEQQEQAKLLEPRPRRKSFVW